MYCTTIVIIIIEKYHDYVCISIHIYIYIYICMHTVLKAHVRRSEIAQSQLQDEVEDLNARSMKNNVTINYATFTPASD